MRCMYRKELGYDVVTRTELIAENGEVYLQDAQGHIIESQIDNPENRNYLIEKLFAL